MTTLTPDQLAELERLEAAMTQGDLVARQEYANRWRLELHREGFAPLSLALIAITCCEVGTANDEQNSTNALGFAALRNAAKPLLEIVRKQEADIAALMHLDVDRVAEIADLERQLVESKAEIERLKTQVSNLVGF